MGKPDLDGGGSSSGYESFAGPEVSVDIDGMLAYYKEMLDIQMAAAAPSVMEVSALSEFIRLGLEPSPATQFPEGAVIARQQRHRQSDFQHFLKDVLDGIRNIGSAAIVLAEIYEGGDARSKASLDDIKFAFSDYNAKAPEGFRKVESWSEYEMRMAQEAGSMSMSMTGNDDNAQVIRPAAGVTIYLYPDGSSKQVISNGYDPRVGTVTTTTTVYGPGGAVLQKTTQQDGKDDQGIRTQTTSVTNYNGDGTGTQSKTSTVTGNDGTMTITNETTLLDSEGKPKGDPTTSSPVTITPGQHTTEQQEQGPVEEAVEQTGSHGTDEYVRDNGRVY
ncbi:hypothetical protein [Micromonospora sonneratiae]|uniref:Uncharacterized protein n=1 Tax=Micromonospora sonneratiae TaxID=1184706 RepID=A0ABW3YRI7_9ACTN